MLAVVALEVPLAVSLGDRVDAEVRSQASSQANLVAATAADLLRPGGEAMLGRLVASAAPSARGRVIIVDRTGTLVADSAGSGALGDDYAGRPEVAAALAGRPTQRTRYSRTLDADLLATAAPVLRGGRPIGAVRITQSIAAVQRATNRVTVELVLIGVLVLALGLAAGAVIARGVARPMRRLDDASQRIAGGELSVRAPVEGSSEQRSLARSFNDMTARLGGMLEAQREFVADSSHQLRTPLTGLRLRIEEARATVTDPRARGDLEAALAEVDRLSRIVDELLLLSRIGEREAPAEDVDLAAAARRAAARWEPAARRAGAALTLEEADGAIARVPPQDLDRILDVLIENALAYGGATGPVEVRVSGNGVDVADRGPGPEAGEEERVFERFHRGREGRQGPPGTGLGLAIARALARSWGGEVSLARGPRGGGLARVRVPLPSLDRRAGRV